MGNRVKAIEAKASPTIASDYPVGGFSLDLLIYKPIR
jgi:hypothetical protein